jgi:hypothetical protein
MRHSTSTAVDTGRAVAVDGPSASGRVRGGVEPVGVAVALTVVAFWIDRRWSPSLFLGRIPIPCSVATAVVVLVLLARPREHRPAATGAVRHDERPSPLACYARMAVGSPSDWAGFYAVMAALLAIAAMIYRLRTGSWIEPVAVFMDALGEEATFRYALPLVIATAVVVARAPSRAVVPCATAVSALLFATMPGHIQQMHARIDIVPFVAFALLMSIVSLRTGALLPVVLAHALVNLCTLPVNLGVAPPILRLAGVMAALGGLVIASRHATDQQRARADFAARLASIEPTFHAVSSHAELDLDFEAHAASLFNRAPERPLNATLVRADAR